MRERKEIEDQIAKADEAMATGSKVPGMTYEEGVSAALRWAQETTDDEPMED